jgi:phosphoribosylformylglycinamidine cyclo-ligase
MRKTKLTSYKAVGINRKTLENYHNTIGRLITSTHSYSTCARILSIIGHYAGLFEINNNVFALHADGVGTKVIIAQMIQKYNTIGIDCVAMNANDIICVGARPVAFIDYIALKSSNNDVIKEILRGLVRGAKIANVPIIGGETAILPDVISGFDRARAFDLAGTILGIVDRKKRIILGKDIVDKDVVLGIESSGLHSNGYSLARKILLSKYSINDQPSFLCRPLGEEMLIPTRIYVKPVLEILQKAASIPVHGLAHITGGSFTIFKQIAVDGPVTLKEMYRTFNMGVGFCVIAPRESANFVCKVFRRYHMSCKEIGTVDRSRRGEVSALLGGKQYTLAR